MLVMLTIKYYLNLINTNRLHVIISSHLLSSSKANQSKSRTFYSMESHSVIENFTVITYSKI